MLQLYVHNMNKMNKDAKITKMKNRRFLTLIIIIGLMVLFVTSGFVVWGINPAMPMPEAIAALQSDPQVSVTSAKRLTFTPAAAQPDTGFIIYPGGHVDYRAYAPTARQIAAHGYLVVIAPMPFNLAVFNPGAAQEIIAAYPEIQNWVVGGHSLGGAMAANFARNNPGSVKGLVLWASYPATSDDLSASILNVVSIYGTRDGLATVEQIDSSLALLPDETTWIAIEGGNHAQFGWYGIQAGDNQAAISRQAQQEQIISATVNFLGNLK